MATGVPETDVFAAADAVLARGERPTVERVRAELGRGSPARVGQLLEQWWELLAQRLKGHTLLPDLPGEVAQGFTEVWRLAVAQAEVIAHAALAHDQNALFAAQTTLTQERKLWEIALAEARATVADREDRLAQTDLQLRERQTLVDQCVAQVADLQHQRNRLQTQIEHQGTELDALRAERHAAQEHIRTVEDRAHQHVDQARQESKALQQHAERTQREHAKAIAQLTRLLDAARSARRVAEQTAAHHAGQVAALEGALRSERRPASKRAVGKHKPPAKSPTRSRKAPH